MLPRQPMPDDTACRAPLRKWLGGLLVASLLAGCQPPGPKALLDGERLLNKGDFARAEARLKIATEILFGNPQAWNHYGLALHSQGKALEAFNAYIKALQLDPNLAPAHFNLGSLLLEDNRFADAAREFAIFTKLQPDRSIGWVMLARAALKAGANDEAERACKSALSLIPGDPEMLNSLGVIHINRKRPREAVQAFNAALDAKANYAPTIYNLAVTAEVFFQNKPAALERYKAYLNLEPSSPASRAVRQKVSNLEMALRPPEQPATAAAPPPVTNAPPVVENKPPTPTVAATPAPAPTTNKVAAPSPAPVAAAATNPPPQTAIAAIPTPAATTEDPPAEPVSIPETNPPPRIALLTPSEPVVPDASSATPVRIPVELPHPNTLEGPADADLPGFGPVATNKPAAQPQNTKPPAEGAPSPTPPTVVQVVSVPAPAPLGKTEEPTPYRSTDARPVAATPAQPAAEPPAPAPTAQTPWNFGVSPGPPAVLRQQPRYPYRRNLGFAPGDRAKAEVLYNDGVKAHNERRLASAIEFYQKAVLADPAFFEPRYNLALAAYRLKDLALSLAAAEEAVAIKPHHLNARYNFSLMLRDANYFQDAANELREVLVDSPDEVRAHYVLGNLYAQHLDQPQSARRHYERLLALEPKHPEAAQIRYWLATVP